MTTPLRALDLFAGTGWGVACQWLDIQEMGVEIMPEACATRESNGMATIYHDVWEGLENDLYVPKYDLLIASPPCQTFSLAGKGSGRKALDDVLEAIELHAYKDPGALRAFGETHDDRTALVLTPLAHVWRDMPRYVAFEQVPTVLPVWEACAEVMREMGYSVWTGNLQAEQYGVPQTRKRAILMARLDGEVQPPTPTHSRYYSRDPKRLDPGVLPWVSMGEALELEYVYTALRSNYGTGGDPKNRGLRTNSQPAPTITSKADRNKWDGVQALSAEEAAALQSYPRWVHERPAPTVVGTRRSEGGMLIGRQLDDGSRRDIGGHQTDVGLRPGMLPGVRVSGEEGATLQTYPRPFTFCGTKSKQFLQIGNAVPPLLARAVLEELTK